MNPTPLPWQIDKPTLYAYVGTANGKRALYHKLIIVTQQGGKGGGRATMIDYDSVREFYNKYIRSGRGDEVPRLPGERPAPGQPGA